MINAKAWVYGKLLANAPLATQMGGTTAGVMQEYPDVLNTLPVVVFSESNQVHGYFGDNLPWSYDISIDIHVFTRYDVSTSAISGAIDDLMTSLLFTLMMSQDMDDPNIKVRHKVLKYSRDSLTAADLV